MKTDDKPVRVGTAIILIDDQNRVLLGKRCGKFMPGVYALPGGKPDFGECPKKAVIRETKEETGLKIFDVQEFTWINNFMPQHDMHYVTLFYVSIIYSGTLEVKEKDKCEKWDWYSQDKLPNPMWPGLERILIKYWEENG